MKKAIVFVSDKVERKLKKLPHYILLEFFEWAKLIEQSGWSEMQN